MPSVSAASVIDIVAAGGFIGRGLVVIGRVLLLVGGDVCG
jgi:hypothetical protein